jgi:uncharacterized protein
MSIFQELYDDVFSMLHHNLPSYLTYHSPAHTAHVIEKAEYICRQENVDGKELYLVKTAALFHDIGFIRQTHNHEEIGCTIAREKLAGYSFSPEEIDLITGMIMATKIPQHPTTLLEKIVADADLEYLGTDQFYPISQNLYREFRHYDPQLTISRFNEIQVNFMRRHHYHTDFCIAHRAGKKQEHLEALLAGMEN